MKKSGNLTLQRNVISEIDEEICLLLAERKKISTDIQNLKKSKKLSQEDLLWEAEQNKNLKSLANRYHLDCQMLIDIWDVIRTHVKK
jgi:chorismate mutase